MSELDAIVATLGVERSANLLRSILPLMHIRRHELLECLSQQDWQGAAHYAHNLLSTGHLLASNNLLDKLKLIEQQQVELIQQPSFTQELSSELESSLQQLSYYIRKI